MVVWDFCTFHFTLWGECMLWIAIPYANIWLDPMIGFNCKMDACWPGGFLVMKLLFYGSNKLYTISFYGQARIRLAVSLM